MVCSLVRTNVTGITSHFSENSDAIIEGCRHFYPEAKSAAETIKTGQFPRHFCPFMDSQIVLPVKRTGLEHQSKDSELESVEAGSDCQVTDLIAPVKDEPTLLSDEGSGLKLAAAKLGWYQVFDRKHITTDIATHWGGSENKKEFRKDIYRILDAPSPSDVNHLLDCAFRLYTTLKARLLIKKISDNRKAICFAFTCHHFTAGHVSDQRGEGLQGHIKTGGMKLALTKATFTEAFDRVMSISRKINLQSREELESLCLEGKRTGRNHAAALSKCKAEAMKLSFVEKRSQSETKWIVKQCSASSASCLIDLKGTIVWRGKNTHSAHSHLLLLHI